MSHTDLALTEHTGNTVDDHRALIVRLCELQQLVVAEVCGYDNPNDCFCGTNGFWSHDASWQVTPPIGWRNRGEAVAFIEEAVRQALARRTAPPQIHDLLPMEARTAHPGGIFQRRAVCSCGWTGPWDSDERLASRAHHYHVQDGDS